MAHAYCANVNQALFRTDFQQIRSVYSELWFTRLYAVEFMQKTFVLLGYALTAMNNAVRLIVKN